MILGFNDRLARCAPVCDENRLSLPRDIKLIGAHERSVNVQQSRRQNFQGQPDPLPQADLVVPWSCQLFVWVLFVHSYHFLLSIVHSRTVLNK